MNLLIEKFLKEKLTVQEEDVLCKWLLEDKKNEETLKKAIVSFEQENRTTKEFDFKSAFEKLSIRIKKEEKQTLHFSKNLFKYAASIAILISTSYFLLRKDSSKITRTESIVANIETDLREKIVITSDNGKSLQIDGSKKALSYLNTENAKGSLIYNTINIPRGKVFKLILSDSTVVWLNADTQLKYPEKFLNNSETRSVFLDGEAYFEVAHNENKPFLVHTPKVHVNVLGTKFNISSYANEQHVKTTLVDGSVRVLDAKNQKNMMMLTPQYQASFNSEDNQFVSKKVDTFLYTSWMEKKIVFQSTPFNELLRKIERAYKVEIENNNTKIRNEIFTGQFDVENIEIIFEALSTTMYFEYEISGNKITIN